MASNSLRGHGGQRHTPYNLRTNELRLHVKFQPPRLTGLAVHSGYTEVETKKIRILELFVKISYLANLEV